MGSRYNAINIALDSYYQIPKSLFIHKQYSDMKLNTKVLYSILLSQVNLSYKNGWIDENGDIYFFMKWQAIESLMGVSHATVWAMVNDLKKHGLLKIYVKV